MRTIRTVGILMMLFVLARTVTYAQQDSSSHAMSTSESVLTAADFKKLSCENVGDALKHLAGVYVRNGQVALRDVAADKVVILFDGQRLNTAQGGGVDIVSLPIDNVEKVEVIRGGNSALYGADAVGGVIKITSKSRSTQSASSAINANVYGTIGSFYERIAGLGFSQSIDKFSYFVNYKRSTSRGDFSYKDPTTSVETIWPNNDQASHDLFVKGAYAINEKSNLAISGGLYQAAVGAPGLIEQMTPLARLYYNNKNMNFNYDHSDIFSNFNLKLQSYFLFFETRYDQPGGLVPIHSKHNNNAYAFEAQQGGSLADYLQVAYGYTFRHDVIESSDIGKKQRNNHAGFASATAIAKEVNFFFNELSITPAIRYDYPTDFDAEFSPKVSIQVQHTGTLQLSLISHISRSYRAPTFNDLYWPRDSYAEGNPNLVPEKGFSYDAGITAGYPVLGSVSLSANYFANKLDNLILWAPGAGGLWRPMNISKTDAQGAELTGRWKPYEEYVEFSVDYTYMTALDKSGDPTTGGKDLIYRPRNKFDASLTLRYAGVEINAVNHYVGKRFTNAANTKFLKSYNVADGNLSYSFKAWDVTMNAKFELMNVNDLSYIITDGTPMPGRAYRFTLACSI